MITFKVGPGEYVLDPKSVGIPAKTPPPVVVPPRPAAALTRADLAASVGAAWDAARPHLAVPGTPGSPNWTCTSLSLYGDDGKGGWRKLGTAVSVYGPDGKGGWARSSTSAVAYGPDGTTPAP